MIAGLNTSPDNFRQGVLLVYVKHGCSCCENLVLPRAQAEAFCHQAILDLDEWRSC